jgi:hypothetical protein
LLAGSQTGVVGLPDVFDTNKGSPEGSSFFVRRWKNIWLLEGLVKRPKASQRPSGENGGELSPPALIDPAYSGRTLPESSDNRKSAWRRLEGAGSLVKQSHFPSGDQAIILPAMATKDPVCTRCRTRSGPPIAEISVISDSDSVRRRIKVICLPSGGQAGKLSSAQSCVSRKECGSPNNFT